MIYLATPYSHPDPVVREQRYLEAMAIVRWHALSEIYLFSPIVYAHPMAKLFGMPGDHNFWKEFDRHYLERAEEVWFARIDGWESSEGMRRERETARNLKKKICVVEESYDPHRYIYTYEQLA